MQTQTPTPHSPKTTHKKTKTYDLTLTLTLAPSQIPSQTTLTLTLIDYIDMAVYGRTYTNADVGGEICRKMDLGDVFGVFQVQGGDEDQGKMGEKELREYKLGDMVQCDNLPSYKIEAHGQVSVYFHVMQLKTKKQVTYESKLSLPKTRDLTPQQLQPLQSLQPVQSPQLLHLLHKIPNLQHQTNLLHKKTLQLQQQLLQTQETLSKKIQKLEQQIEDIKTEQKREMKEVKEIREIGEKCGERVGEVRGTVDGRIGEVLGRIQEEGVRKGEQIKRVQHDLEIVILRMRKEMEDTLEMRIAQLKKQLLKKQEEHKYEHQHEHQEEQETQQKVQPLFPNQPNTPHFKTTPSQLQYTSPITTWTDYILNPPFPLHPTTAHPHPTKFKFRLKITQTKYRNIFIGVVDHSRQKNQRSSHASGNAFCYYGENGNKWPEGVREGDGFRQGDVVEVDVDRELGLIGYVVNGVLKARQKSQALKDRDRVFVPYVEMAYRGDTVEYIAE